MMRNYDRVSEIFDHDCLNMFPFSFYFFYKAPELETYFGRKEQSFSRTQLLCFDSNNKGGISKLLVIPKNDLIRKIRLLSKFMTSRPG